MAMHSSILAWDIPGTEEPSRLQSMGSQRVGEDLVGTHTHATYARWKRNVFSLFKGGFNSFFFFTKIILTRLIKSWRIKKLMSKLKLFHEIVSVVSNSLRLHGL